MDERCKNCRHWKPWTESQGECQHDMVTVWGEEIPENGVSIYDGAGGFYTGPEFGCVHFEAKPHAP